MAKLNVVNNDGDVVEVAGFAKKRRRRPEDKWTKGLISLGFCTIPSILMWAQGRLELTTEQFTVILQLGDFWWDAGEPPFPTKEMLAGRMGMGTRQVQRHLTALEKKKLIRRNQIANGYDMSSLVKKLVAMEPEFRKMIEQKRKRRQKIEAKAS
jgi:DNA-binding MarR family transcriptional regulator